MRRPALAAAGLYGLGILGGCRWSLSVSTLLCASSILFLAVCVVFRFQRLEKQVGLLLGLLVCTLGILRYEAVTEDLPATHLVHFTGLEEEVEVWAEVVREPEEVGKDLRVYVDVRKVLVEGRPYRVQGLALIRFRKLLPDLEYGDGVRLRVRLLRPDPARNPGAFDYRNFLAQNGVYAVASVYRADQVLAVRVGGGTLLWNTVVLPVRRGVRAAVDNNLSGAPAGLLKGVLLGEKRGVPEDVKEAFRRCGVNHVLAVSGLHVGLIGAALFFGLGAMGLGRRATGAGTAIGLVLYALVTGLSPSVVRASVMGAFVLFGRMVDREGEGLNTLGGAAIGLLIFRPLDLFHAGFQLSFAATGGILLLYRPIRSWFPGGDESLVGKWVCAPMAVSLAAQAGTAPLVAAYFGHLSLLSLPANLLVVPLMGASVGLGLLTTFFFPFLEFPVALLNGANWLILKGAVEVARMMAAPGWAFLEVPVPSGIWAGVYVCVLLLLVPEIRSRRAGRVILFVGLGLSNVWVWSPLLQRSSELEILVLDVGQGDGVFLQFPNGRTMLVDGGLRAKGLDMGERVLVPFLRQRGIRRIDVVVASHPHSDHIGGLVTVLERFDVGWYLDAGQPYSSWTARRIRELIQEKGIAYRVVAAGDSLLGLGGVGGLVLHPVPEYVSAEQEAPLGTNNGSVVLRFTYGDIALLLTGDVEHETDKDLLRWGSRLRADVLKAAHHGSRTSSTVPFLNAVRPKVVTVSCGVGNVFKHPAPEVIRRYEQMDARVFRTDRQGAIQIVVTETGLRAYAWMNGEEFSLQIRGGKPILEEPKQVHTFRGKRGDADETGTGG